MRSIVGSLSHALTAQPRPYWVRRYQAIGRRLTTGALDIFQFGCTFLFTQNYLLTSQQCIGPSMLPTLGLSGDVVLVWPTAGGLVRPQLGDVVICSSPTDPTMTVCKRVTGMPVRHL